LPYEERSVAATFATQFEQLNQLSPDINNLLKVLSFLDPDRIPVGMIVQGAKEWLDPQHRPQDIPSQPQNDSPIFSVFRLLVTLIFSPIQFPTAIKKLVNLSLVERRSHMGSSSLWMHDLMRFMVQEAMKKDETYREWLQSSI
jgi:hypothetical protein